MMSLLCVMLRRALYLLAVPETVNVLRHMLRAVGTEHAELYRPHDLRRGHAEDLRLSGLYAISGRGALAPVSDVFVA